jgi:hypothetical protein
VSDIEIRLKDKTSIAVAVILIALGVLFLLDQWFNMNIAGYLWPFFIVVPGVFLFIFSLSLSAPEGAGTAIFASIVTMTGLLLLCQNTTGLWATWAYAWALVAPTSVGLGMMLYGSLKNREGMVAAGRSTTKVGLGLFLGFAAFFEGIINISGLGISTWGMPLLLIALGVYVMWRTLRPR